MTEEHGSAAETVEIILEGGPKDLPPDLRAGRTLAGDYKVKIVHRGGYEHFERTEGRVAGGEAVVFRWMMRTKMAE